jgi:hypothetical protein
VGLHTNELGAEVCEHAHAVPEDVRTTEQDVTLSGAACSHSPAHRWATHRPTGLAAAFTELQLWSRRTAHASTSDSVPAHDVSLQHASTSAVQRFAMH